MKLVGSKGFQVNTLSSGLLVPEPSLLLIQEMAQTEELWSF